MLLRNTVLSVFMLLLSFGVNAQAIDNTLSFKNINDKYFRLNYENDFFSATDKYYTQGIHLELVAPWLRNFPFSKLLVHPLAWQIKYGVGIEHDGYTPTNIDKPFVLYGDRPFAACLFLKTFLIATDADKKERFSSALSTGVIGQAAGGAEMQTGIHRWLNDLTPHGWPNQLHNDVILNYQVDVEKQLLSYSNIFLLDVDAMGRLGTLSDKAGVGGAIMIGYFQSPFGDKCGKKQYLQVYAYEHPEVDVIGYDATLQGGMFNHSSPYTISSDNISRIVFQNRFGFVVNYKWLYLEYFQSLLSSEFRTSDYHVWGGIQISVGL
jgi:lipid A 3-O-deacylase